MKSESRSMKRVSRAARNLAFTALATIGMLSQAAPVFAHVCGFCANSSWQCTELVLCAITQCCGTDSGQATFMGDCKADVRCSDGKFCGAVDPYAC